jgi:hypothetical protein
MELGHMGVTEVRPDNLNTRKKDNSSFDTYLNTKNKSDMAFCSIYVYINCTFWSLRVNKKSLASNGVLVYISRTFQLTNIKNVILLVRYFICYTC